jgi:polyphosphate kinase
MDFPEEVFSNQETRNKPFIHPLFTQPVRILEVLNKQDVILHFPYHSFNSIIDLLREAAIDPYVETIKITCYRLAKESKIIMALVNAIRNGKKVTVVLELRARFDEAANLKWKRILEEEGVTVVVGLPDQKIHGKVCLISKRISKTLKHYGFVSTGNLNENTARYYGDHCLLTADKRITSDIVKVFDAIEKPEKMLKLAECKSLIFSPINTRSFFINKIKAEIKNHKEKLPAEIIIKLNSFTDEALLQQIYAAAQEGVSVKMIIRGICAAQTSNKKWKSQIHAISIVDEYLEHARILYFNNKNKHDYYISSADWMVRNIDHRIEVTAPIYDDSIKTELQEILAIQLSGNVKARILDNEQQNFYVQRKQDDLIVRSQVEIYNLLSKKNYQ